MGSSIISIKELALRLLGRQYQFKKSSFRD